jgi:hypothetical protein
MKEIGITSSSTQLGINGGMKSCSLVTNIGMSFLADKMGRRPMYLISVSTDITGRDIPHGISTSPLKSSGSTYHVTEWHMPHCHGIGEESVVRRGLGRILLLSTPAIC